MRRDLSKKLLGFVASAMIMAAMFAVPVLAEPGSVTKNVHNVPINGINGGKCKVTVTMPESVTMTNDDSSITATASVSDIGFSCEYSMGQLKIDFNLQASEVTFEGSTNSSQLVIASGNLGSFSVSGITGTDASINPSSFSGSIGDITMNVSPDSSGNGNNIQYSNFMAAGGRWDLQITMQQSSSSSSSSNDDDDDDDDDSSSSSSSSSTPAQSAWTPAPASAAATQQQTATTQLSTAQSTIAALSVIPTASKVAIKSTGLALNMTNVNTIDANTSKLIAANSDIPYNVTFMFMGKPMVCTVPAGFNYSSYIKPDGTMNIHEVLWAVYLNQLRQQTRSRTTRARR